VSYRTGSLTAVWALALVAIPWLSPVTAATLPRRAEVLEDHFLMQAPSLGLAQVYKLMSPAQRIALAGKLQQLVVSKVPPHVEDLPALANLPPQQKEMIKKLSELAHSGTPEQVEALIAAQDLDHLAPIPTPLMEMYHQFVLGDVVPGGNTARKDILAADVANPAGWKQAIADQSAYILPDAGPAEVEILAATDSVPAAEVPKNTDEPALEGAVTVATRIVRFPDHVLVNSGRLARGLNLLMRPKSAGPVTLKIAGKSTTVDSAQALVHAIAEQGEYDVAVYDARMFVNFLDYSVQKLGATLPIRIPTWAATEVETAPGKSLLVPICHTEHIMVLYRKGSEQPEAMVRWFLAMPDAVNQGTLFRPAIYRRWSWSGWRVVRAYDGVGAAEKLVTIAKPVMQAFNYLQDKFKFPGHAYGTLGVCNDTTGILEAAMLGDPAKATAWPLVRDPRFDMYLGERLATVGFGSHVADGMPVLDLPCDSRPDLYPGVHDREALLRRIGANIPVHDLSALHFKDLGTALEALSGSSAALREGLSLAPASAPQP